MTCVETTPRPRSSQPFRLSVPVPIVMIDSQIENTSATCCWSIETQEVDWRQRFTSRVEWQVVDCIIMHPRKTGPSLQAVDRTLTMVSDRVRNPDIGNADSKTSGTIACTPRARSPALGWYNCLLLALGDAGRWTKPLRQSHSAAVLCSFSIRFQRVHPCSVAVAPSMVRQSHSSRECV